MSQPSESEYVFYRGTKFQVEFYFTDKGALPAKEYLDNLDHKIKAKLGALVVRMAEEGRIFDETKYREVDKDAKVFEFKLMAYRFFNFFYKDRRILITNAYRKKSQKVDPRELQKAINMKKDYERRRREGSYYGKEEH